MRIAQLAPIWKPIPPQKYGGSELIVSYLTEELVRQGHDVTLFASGDSKTSATLSSVVGKNVYDILGRFDWSNNSYNLIHAQACFKRAAEFDVIHNHMGPEVLLFAPFFSTPVVSTMHSSLPPDFPLLAQVTKDQNYVSISKAQRNNAPDLNWIETVYHGIDPNGFEFNETPEGYLFFLGTISPHKGVDIAIEIARVAKKRLIIAGDQRSEFEEFFNLKVKPFVDGDQVQFLGEVDFKTKVKFYKNAEALLFPTQWNEAFGMVVPEAMLTGTPVIGSNRGALPELIETGVTGFIAKEGSVDEYVALVARAKTLNRKIIRDRALERFSAERMAKGYVAVYEKVMIRK